MKHEWQCLLVLVLVLGMEGKREYMISACIVRRLWDSAFFSRWERGFAVLGMWQSARQSCNIATAYPGPPPRADTTVLVFYLSETLSHQKQSSSTQLQVPSKAQTKHWFPIRFYFFHKSRAATTMTTRW